MFLVDHGKKAGLPCRTTIAHNAMMPCQLPLLLLTLAMWLVWSRLSADDGVLLHPVLGVVPDFQSSVIPSPSHHKQVSQGRRLQLSEVRTPVIIIIIT